MSLRDSRHCAPEFIIWHHDGITPGHYLRLMAPFFSALALNIIPCTSNLARPNSYRLLLGLGGCLRC
jgi:hypothetical protein